jgi:hypothetical protein
MTAKALVLVFTIIVSTKVLTLRMDGTLKNKHLLPQVQSFGTLVGRFPVENRLTMLCASSFNSTSRNR